MRQSLLLLAACISLSAGSARAASIEVFGIPGGPGEDGGPALAVADTPDADNQASAFGGDGGDDVDLAFGGPGGAAEARAVTSFAGDVSALAFAQGGAGGDVPSTVTFPSYGGDGGAASVSATAEGSGNVSVSAEAVGGAAGSGGYVMGQAGAASVSGPVRGISTGGGDVSVILTGRGGNGGAAILDGPNGDGADVTLHDAVSGETSGLLFLRQTAIGGDAGADAPSPDVFFGDVGNGGAATSELSVASHSSSTQVEVQALGGQGSKGPAGIGTAAESPGGSADVAAEVFSDHGEVTLSGHSEGGAGGGTGDGGAAALRLYAQTGFDGQAIRVGVDGVASLVPGAYGGNGDQQKSPYYPHDGYFGRGGDARSESSGIALGESDVTVIDRAVGGRGGTEAATLGLWNSDGDKGGDAWSSAEAVTHGAGSVQASATAIGGRGGDGSFTSNEGQYLGGNGGVARASARGVSDTGNVLVTVDAIGGDAGDGYGAGASSLVDNAALGETQGDLTIRQSALGGSTYLGWGGAARSSLTIDREGDGALDVTATARGGDGRNPDAPATYATGGDAFASIDARDGGSAPVSVFAQAVGGDALEHQGKGGAADVFAWGESLGGGDVTVYGEAVGGDGELAPDVTLSNAVGGRTTGYLYLEQVARSYGSADSYIDTPLLESSAAVVRNSARGSAASVGTYAQAMRDLYAESRAIAVGPDNAVAYTDASMDEGARVTGNSEALALGGGNTEASSYTVAYYGDAEVASRALAIAGAPGIPGDASANATAEGAGIGSVSALATASASESLGSGAAASANGFGVHLVRARAEAAGRREVSAIAMSDLEGAMTIGVFRHAGGAGARIYSNADTSSGSWSRESAANNILSSARNVTLAGGPLEQANARTWLEGNPNTAAALGAHGEILGMGLMAASGQTAIVENVITFDVRPEVFVPGDSLHFAILDTEADEAGFMSLSIAVEVSVMENAQLLSLSFDDASSAEAALDDRVFAFPSDVGDPSLYGASVEVVIGSDRGVGDFLTKTSFLLFATHAVPEPRSFALLALVGLSLALRARVTRA